MTRTRVIVCSVAVLIAVSPGCGGPTAVTGSSPSGSDASIESRVDRLFADWQRSDSPGCSLGVGRNGRVVYARGYGMANVELGVPITPESVFPAASIAKPFTAMSILLLAQRGRLSLDDDVRRYIPQWAEQGQRITIRHLLTHTAGLRDVFLLLALAAPREDGNNPNDAVLRMLARQRGLNFPPGTECQYNNGGYNLLGHIVKRVSGQSLHDFAAANIFGPLEMRHTHIHDDPSRLVPNRASGYSREGGRLRVVSADMGGIVGNAGLYTTVLDLLRWEQNFVDAQVGDAALLNEMQTPARLADGRTAPFGLGLAIGEFRGLRTVGHSGSDRGISSQVVRYPAQGLAVALLCNIDTIGPEAATLTNRVAEIFLADALPAAAATGEAARASASPVSLSAQEIARKEGLYRDPSSESLLDLLRVVSRDGKLVAVIGAGEQLELTPLSAQRFAVPNTNIVIEFVPADGPAPELRVVGAGAADKVLQRLPPFTASEHDLQELAGTYRSPELDVDYTVRARGGLIMEMPGRADVTLSPIVRDVFQPTGLAGVVVQVVRGARGAVTGFTLHARELRVLRFDRVSQRARGALPDVPP